MCVFKAGTTVNQLPWKLPPTSMEVAISVGVNMLPWKCSSWTPIPPTSTEVNQFPWKLPPTFMEVDLVPSTSMEAAMEVATFSSLIYFHESFHRLPWKMEVG